MQTAVYDTRPHTPLPQLDRPLRDLLAAAHSEAGLDMLLLFDQDPATCDTAAGYAMRLQRPLPEVREAIGGLLEYGIVEASTGPASADGRRPCFWLSTATGRDAPQLLRRLAELYVTGPAERLCLVRALCVDRARRPIAQPLH